MAGAENGRQVPPWREINFWLLIALTTAVYFPRLTELPTRGEETRWAQVAVEMILSGDWIVPRQQGEPFLSRPPLGSWLMAVVALVRGEMDLFAVRLPTALAVLGTSIVVYLYCRRLLGSSAALIAALAFATSVEVLQIGRLAETDGLFTFLVASSLLAWHHGRSAGWSAAGYWSAGYSLAALAALAKGIQAPAFFIASTWLYLLVSRRPSELLRRGHLLGVASFLVVLGAWQLPFFLLAGPTATRGVWGSDVGLRFVDRSWRTIALHAATFPLEVLACALPWSLALPALFFRSRVELPEEQRKDLTFLYCCLAATFPSCWLTPGAKVRYFLPLFPILAVLVGAAVERATGFAESPALQRWRRRFLWTAGSLIALLGVLVLAAAVIEKPAGQSLARAPVFTCVVVALLLAAAAGMTRLTLAPASWRIRAAALLLAGTAGGAHTTVWLNTLIARSIDTAGEVAAVRTALPAGAKLVSFGPVHHRFIFCFGKPIPLSSLPNAEAAVAGGDYFCFPQWGLQERTLPFAWEPIAVVICDRNVKQEPQEMVVVGRRTLEETAVRREVKGLR